MWASHRFYTQFYGKANMTNKSIRYLQLLPPAIQKMKQGTVRKSSSTWEWRPRVPLGRGVCKWDLIDVEQRRHVSVSRAVLQAHEDQVQRPDPEMHLAWPGDRRKARVAAMWQWRGRVKGHEVRDVTKSQFSLDTAGTVISVAVRTC